MVKSNQFRVFGPALDIPDSYVDIEVGGIDEEGNIYLSDTGSEREWKRSGDEVQRLLKEDEMLRSDEVETHKLWERLDKLTKDMTEGRVTTPFGQEHVESAQRELFKAAYEETR